MSVVVGAGYGAIRSGARGTGGFEPLSWGRRGNAPVARRLTRSLHAAETARAHFVNRERLAEYQRLQKAAGKE
jgi:hypothetical protein